MKKHMTRALALVLTVVMILGAVPFAMAETAIEVTASKYDVWPGQTVTLRMNAGDNVTTSGVEWDNGEKANTISYTVPEDAVGTHTVGVKVTFGTPGDYTYETGSVTLNINTPADSISISGGAAEAMVGESVTFSASTAPSGNDSDIDWSVAPSGASVKDGRFKATEEGTYTITATAKNGPSVDDDVTDTRTITVKPAAYRVSVSDATIGLTSKTSTVSYTVTATTEGAEVPEVTPSFSVTSGSTYLSVDENGLITPKKAGTAEVTVTVTIDGQSYSGSGDITVTDKGAITCAQDMDEVNGDSASMTFELTGVEADSVAWTVSVSGEETFSVSDSSFTGSTRATVTVEAEDGNGVAAVKVTADWGDNAASATFYISFYERNSFSVELADGVDEFDFDENDVFSRVQGNSSGATRKSLQSMITDGAGTRVIFTEDRAGNSRIGRINCGNKSSFAQYDPDDENDYAITDLDELSFEVLGEGEYELDFEVYDLVNGKGLATSMGTITIITGEGGKGDIEYTCNAGGSVALKVADFEDYWEEADAGEKNEDLNYVTFEVSSSTYMDGTLYHDGSVLKAAWKCYADYDNKKNTYDLSKVTYKANVNQSGTDSVAFTCYGEEGSKVSGVLTFKISGGDVDFSDVKSTDWFYDEVAFVVGEGVMNGTSKTEFSPNGTLTRAMVVTMLYRMENEPAVASADTFTDVSYGSWYYSAVEWAAKNGIVNGVGNGKFAPDTAITREQLAAILYRYTTEYKNSSASGGSFAGFSDADKVSEYAQTAMKWAVGEGIITGDNGKLMPQGNATRAQAAAMFARFMNNVDTSSRNDDDEDEEEVAYVVGTKYHLDEDCAGKSAKEMKLSKAEKNYKACTKCVD